MNIETLIKESSGGYRCRHLSFTEGRHWTFLHEIFEHLSNTKSDYETDICAALEALFHGSVSASIVLEKRKDDLHFAHSYQWCSAMNMLTEARHKLNSKCSIIYLYLLSEDRDHQLHITTSPKWLLQVWYVVAHASANAWSSPCPVLKPETFNATVSTARKQAEVHFWPTSSTKEMCVAIRFS